jgi:crotonobetainyl-CoA:carnitine CoA-transferase CaiB-like acyl-CoA transferase
MESRSKNRAACIAEFDDIFGRRTLAEWQETLSEQEGQWSVVQQVGDLSDDDQAWANGYLQKGD